MDQSAIKAIEETVRAAFESSNSLSIEEIIHEPLISFRVKELATV